MNLVALDTRLVTWPLDGSGAARGRRERSALLVEIRTLTGAIGLGEAAPLPGISVDTLDDAGRSIGALRSMMPLDLVDDPTALGQLIEHFAPSSAARFALETAVLTALAAERGVALSALLGGGAETLPIAVVVDDLEGALRAHELGVRCVKLKSHANDDFALARAIAAALPDVRLRIDANRTWPEASVRERLAVLATLPVELVEEPSSNSLALIREALPCMLGLDESLADLVDDEFAEVLQAPGLGALVLKPTLLGGLTRCLLLAARARAAGKRAIVTHALEGPIGTAAVAELALAVGDVPGLAPHPGLAAWRLALPQLVPGGIRAAASAGLGFGMLGLGTLLATLDSTPRRRTPSPSPPPLSSATRLDSALSIVRAAIDMPTSPAIVTTRETSSFADAAVAASQKSSATRPALPGAPRRARIVVATPTVETVSAIHAALDSDWPIALLHPRHSPGELARQREMVASSSFVAGDAVVLFTSGSTAAPRGVVLSRKALLAAADASTHHLGWLDEDRWLVALSLAHSGGLAPVVRCLVARKPIVLGSDGEPLADLLARVTLASLVPTQLASVLDDPGWQPGPALRAILLGGAAAPATLLAAAAARGVPVLVTYGATETFGQVATAPLARAGDPHAPLVPLRSVAIAAGTRSAPKPIRIRGPMLATRYLDGEAIAPELATADLGFVEHGTLHVVGRADDVIITGGENVHPSTIEAVLVATPGVRAACAFGIEDARWGQIVGAAIAAEPMFDEDEAAAYWHATLPAHARPRELAIAIGELPLLANGKLDRRRASELPRSIVRYAE
jgi:L-alanine-DL-glutamate epimerase-like enolase superfamily enzyme/acyl-coenzyme A synthetase/AMP-(fatty) acid ligase